MQPKVLKYILDIEQAVAEIENVISVCNHNFNEFSKNQLAIRSLERLLEIIGEAVKNLLQTDSDISIKNSQRIISFRNRLAHAYDSIELSILWAIAIRNIPELKEEISEIKKG